LREAGLRVSGDYRAEKVGAKIRDAQLEMIPYMAIVGAREQEQGTVALRDRVQGDLGAMPLDAVINRLQEEIRLKLIRRSDERKNG
ncbi:MAG TPA: His/Gly/Thr/Pro-type tRNA ligase C-terminal domain-containing protein, partial [Thermogutta sp.]|nr:His/Gly/Thr/Pro-type tRNA ligase C-terminal domain-containing protein [Thermogutta sp.]